MSLHAQAVALLSGWVAPDPGQEALREAYLDHLSEHPDGVWRDCAPGHITASALVIDPQRDQVLLTLHPKVGRWLQLGGHLENGDPTVQDGALREATEESGIAGLRLTDRPAALDRHRVNCRPGGSLHFDIQYVAVAPEGARERISAESLDLRWFGCDDLPVATDDSVRRLVAIARRPGRDQAVRIAPVPD